MSRKQGEKQASVDEERRLLIELLEGLREVADYHRERVSQTNIKLAAIEMSVLTIADNFLLPHGMFDDLTNHLIKQADRGPYLLWVLTKALWASFRLGELNARADAPLRVNALLRARQAEVGRSPKTKDWHERANSCLASIRDESPGLDDLAIAREIIRRWQKTWPRLPGERAIKQWLHSRNPACGAGSRFASH